MSDVTYLAERTLPRREDSPLRFALCSCGGRGEWERLLARRDVLLTSYCPDGTPRSVHVWSYPHGEQLLVWTDPESWKVRRIRANPEILLTSCTCRGHTIGLRVQALARILSGEESRSLYRAIALSGGSLGKISALALGPRRCGDTVALECTRVA